MRYRLALVFLVPWLAAGCADLLGIHPAHHAVDGGGGGGDGGDTTPDAKVGGGPDGRAGADAKPGSPDAQTCGWPFVPARVDPCDLPDTNPQTDLGDAVLDTTNGTLKVGDQQAVDLAGTERTQSGGPRFRAERFASLTIHGRLKVKGSRPLALFIDGDLRIAAGGALDVSPVRSSDGSSEPAPGGGDADRCGDDGVGGEGAYGASQTAGSGGGGGGAFGGAGATGGRGGGDLGGKGGTAGMVNASPGVLRGGCQGGISIGNSLVGSDGGFGGGAIQLSVAGQLIVEDGASIDASGAGGGPAFTDFGDIDGGGGGGAGGLIFLEAGAVVVQGALCANGGGGGESHGGDGGQQGASGLCADAPAPGGATGGGGANGGAGGYRDHPDGTPGSPGFGLDGGGGGGGGVGRIQIRSVQAVSFGPNAMVSPAPEP